MDVQRKVSIGIMKSQWTSHLGIPRWFLLTISGMALFVALDYGIAYALRQGIEHRNRTEQSVEQLFRESSLSTLEIERARKFETDTLPSLLKEGLVKQFKQSQGKTLLLVDRLQWSRQPQEAKVDLLAAILASSRVRGFSAWTDVRDFRTGDLIAGISMSGGVELYE